MTKEDLKTGMIVETKKQERYLVIKDSVNTKRYGTQDLVLINVVGFICGDKYDNDLIIKPKDDSLIRDSKHDIIRVYKADIRGLMCMFKNDNLELIWERSEDSDKK